MAECVGVNAEVVVSVGCAASGSNPSGAGSSDCASSVRFRLIRMRRLSGFDY